MQGAPADGDLLRAMNREIAHRGPDGDGVFLEREVALGHRRLSIIDLAGGHQPLGNEDDSIQIVFNGEIYNFVELRQQLEAAGHRFRTHSDTEVIVHAYEEWGDRCVTRFNGMFAFALWDIRRRRLLCARDHLGIKPLYYFENGRELVFASEIKALLRHPSCPKGVDESALAELFTFRYVPSPKTLFQGILKLPPGHLLAVENGRTKVERFWLTIPRPAAAGNEPELIAEYQALLEDAVRIQLRSDVPLGLFLSSGVDSGMLLAMMAKGSATPIKTFTIGFEGGERTNEVADAAGMAKMFGAEHYAEMLAPSDYANYYERYMGDIEEPVGNETAAAFYFVSRLTAKHVKVALSGQGADEPWAGYHRYKGIHLSGIYSRLPRTLTRSFAYVVNRLPGRFERLKRGATSLAEPDLLTRMALVYSFFSPAMKQSLYTGSMKTALANDPLAPQRALAGLQSDVSHLDALTQMLYLDTRTNLPDDLLMVGDKTSMACSIESRVPFLDYRLVEFIERLPVNLKLHRLTGKYLHKKAALKWLPPEIVYRPKKGFANPVEDWFRHSMRPLVEDCLLSSTSSMRRYFDQNYIRRILELDRTGAEQYRRHIYLLVSLELWHRRFIGT